VAEVVDKFIQANRAFDGSCNKRKCCRTLVSSPRSLVANLSCSRTCAPPCSRCTRDCRQTRVMARHGCRLGASVHLGVLNCSQRSPQEPPPPTNPPPKRRQQPPQTSPPRDKPAFLWFSSSFLSLERIIIEVFAIPYPFLDTYKKDFQKRFTKFCTEHVYHSGARSGQGRGRGEGRASSPP